mmetsp:Transcript_32051/g.83004  ORF Transcript_32051/g.83004 Transcript_32051/m.83004 type:complete len:226 (-) Transcript_32051:4-681(-)
MSEHFFHEGSEVCSKQATSLLDPVLGVGCTASRLDGRMGSKRRLVVRVPAMNRLFGRMPWAHFLRSRRILRPPLCWARLLDGCTASLIMLDGCMGRLGKELVHQVFERGGRVGGCESEVFSNDPEHRLELGLRHALRGDVLQPSVRLRDDPLPLICKVRALLRYWLSNGELHHFQYFVGILRIGATSASTSHQQLLHELVRQHPWLTASHLHKLRATRRTKTQLY